jgi:hypothetical protein
VRREDFDTSPSRHGDTETNTERQSFPDAKSVAFADCQRDPDWNAERFAD